MEASYFNVVLIELVCNWLKDAPFLHLFIHLFPYASILYLWFVEWLSVYIVYGAEGQIKKKKRFGSSLVICRNIPGFWLCWLQQEAAAALEAT